MAHRTQVFISYSHQDKTWLERLQVHLKPLEREGVIKRWDDTRIQPGARWREEIRHALASAKVAVVLVSADFLASDFIVTEELPPLLVAAEADGALILPLILSPSRFEQTPLAQFQAVNSPSQPLMGLPKSDLEAVFVCVGDTVARALSPPATVRKQATALKHDSASPEATQPAMGDGPIKHHGIVAWLRQNKEWVFSGIGVAILTLLLGWFFSPSRPEPAPVNVESKGGVAAGRDIEGSTIIITGPKADSAPGGASEQEKNERVH